MQHFKLNPTESWGCVLMWFLLFVLAIYQVLLVYPNLVVMNNWSNTPQNTLWMAVVYSALILVALYFAQRWM